MKTKRLLSALVAVAMMVTMLVSFSTVSYAAEVTPKVTVTVTEMTAEELEAEYLTVGEGQHAYWVVGSISDYGTLEADRRTGHGRKLQSLSVKLRFDGLVEDYFDYSEAAINELYYWDFYGIARASMQKGISTLEGDDGKVFNFGWSVSDGATAYPTTASAASAAVTATEELTFFKFAVRTNKENFTVSLEDAEAVITTFSATEGPVQENYSKRASTLTTNADTLTFGTAAPAVTVGGTSATETDGVTITGTDKKYDNAFAVSATITATAASEVGVLFIPATVLGSAELTAANGAKAAYADSAAIGGGAVTIRAAIKGIPRALEGQNLDMVTRAYALVSGEYNYGTPETTTVNFGDTGEVE